MRPLLAALLLSAGCHIVSGLDSFDEDRGSGGGGADGVGGTGAAGASEPVGGSGGSGPLELVGRGVLARWYLDEPAGAPTVADSITPAVDLAVERNATGSPELTGDDGVRGATWEQEGTDGYVRAAVADNKLESLDGQTEATIEAVMSLSAVANGQTRLIHYGADTESGRFSLRAEDINTVELWVDSNDRYHWPVDLTTPRLVIHLVYDSNAADAVDRAKLYVDGVLETNGVVQSELAQGFTLDIASSNPVEFHIGNRAQSTPSDGRSAKGTYHYVALYDVALTATEVAANAAALAPRDDP